MVMTRSLPDRPKRSSGPGSGPSATVGAFMASLLCIAPSPEAAQEADDAPQQGPRQTRGKIADGRPFSRLGQGRIRQDQLAQRPHLEALLDGQGPRGDELAGMRADDGGADNAPLAGGDHLDMAARLALGLGAVVVVE